MLKDSPVRSTHWLLMAVLGLAEFSRGALIIALIPSYITGPLAAPLILVGWAISSHYFMDTVFRGPAGWLVDRVGPARVLTMGMAVEVVALIGTMNTQHPDLAVFFVAMLGIGTATHWPAVVTGANRLTPSSSRASVMGLVFAVWLAGSGLGPILINFLMEGRDRVAFLILIAADVLAFAITMALTDRRLAPLGHKPHPVHGWFKLLWPFRSVIPGMFLQNLTLGVMIPLLQPFTHQILHLSHWQFAGLLLGGGAFAVLLMVPMGKVTDRFGLKIPLVGGFFMAGLALAMMGTVRNFLLLIAVGGVTGMAYAMILPAWNTFLAKMIPQEIEGWLWGVFMTVEGLGMAVGPIVGTRLFEISPGLPFFVSAVVLAAMGVLYWTLPFERWIRFHH